MLYKPFMQKRYSSNWHGLGQVLLKAQNWARRPVKSIKASMNFPIH